ncbi:hypothetical protein GCM10007036_20310 [Alsobacter metallidurans]|uniref:Uncharacterized protein n=1 Tax=Alsobacter metallidurans TaxID=340221 RepID=A0A917MHQ3_9HYPH|nr:hypothetical protein GCM10007036_20310 [Alsobacter metallidurans]
MAETLDSVVDHSAVVLPVPPAQSRTVALLLGAMVIGCLIAGSLLRHSTATFTQVAETPAWAAPPQLAGR